jgi:hypothetical protein
MHPENSEEHVGFIRHVLVVLPSKQDIEPAAENPASLVVGVHFLPCISIFDEGQLPNPSAPSGKVSVQGE